MREAILAAIERRGGKHISFVELGRDELEGWKGQHALCAHEYPNIIFWLGLSEEAVTAIRGLIVDGVITLKPTVPLVYFVDGSVLNMPVARRRQKYLKPHWLPVCINLVEKRTT